jgi:hypothetical protein
MGEFEITCTLSFLGLAAVVTYEAYRGWSGRIGRSSDAYGSSDDDASRDENPTP